MAVNATYNVYLDWNNDGDFADANEMVLSQAVSAGQNQNLPLDLPASVADGTYYARFRLFSSEPPLPALSYSGTASSGEVEDYRFRVSGGVPTPVTLAYFAASRQSGSVNFRWVTSTETANAGFNIYVEQGGVPVKLNSQLIASRVSDSIVPQSYTYSASTTGTVFYIEDVNFHGEAMRHGPYQAGRAYGAVPAPTRVDWSTVQAEAAAAEASYQAQVRKELSASLTSRFADAPLSVSATSAALSTASLNLLVTRTGIHRISYEQLQAAGLDLAGMPSANISLTNKGQAVPVYIEGATFGPGSFIEFLGEAIDTRYTGTNVYTVRVSPTPVAAIPVVNAAPGTAALLPSFTDTLVVNRQLAYANYAPGDDPWYDTYMMTYTTPKSWNIPFSLSAVSPSSAGSMELEVWGLTQWAVADDHHLKVSINGIQVGDFLFDGFNEQKLNLSIPSGVLRSGSNTLTLTLPGDRGVSYDVVSLDKFTINYQRTFAAVSNQIKFSGNNLRYRVSGLTSSNVVVYRVTPAGPQRLSNVVMTTTASGLSHMATFAGTAEGATYYAAATSAIITPATAATRLTADLNRPVTYLVITHSAFSTAALAPLVNARRAQGYSVRVVNVADIYAQYSYGIVDPQAIKDYISHAARNLGTQYVLLVGGDTYDNRNYLRTGTVSFIPSLYTSTDIYSTFAPADPMYADIDNDNIPDLPIGRFPVRTAAELQLMINKTLAYGTKTYGQTAFFAADKYDGVESYRTINADMASTLPAGWASSSVSLDTATVSVARQQILDAMNQGTALITYTGHSSTTAWTTSGLFNTAYASNLTNAGKPFVAVQWGCWNNYYVDPVNVSLVQSLLVSGDRGAAAVLGSSTRTNSQSEAMLGQLLTPRLATPGMTIGQAMQAAKDELALTQPTLSDVLLGWTLMGDPTLVIQP